MARIAIGLKGFLMMVSLFPIQPLAETLEPSDQAGVAETVRAAYEARQPVYPVGGSTALNYGIPPTRPGVQLQLGGLAKIVDYTPRDMTILVEAGVRMADLAATLAAEHQQLPIDVPRAAEATLGGVVATNWNGPRRYGFGTVRDYVIGIHAVDGRGLPFKGGGRVVKNVAGYDFCKLLTGSLGSLGVITQIALKVKPLHENSSAFVAECPDLTTAHVMLGRLSMLAVPPVAIDLLVGGAWNNGGEDAVRRRHAIGNRKSEIPHASTLVVRIEGTRQELAWLGEQVQYELWTGGGLEVCQLEAPDADVLWQRQVEFADRGPNDIPDASPLVLKIAVPPSATTTMMAAVLDVDPNCTIQAHAGNGILYARFSQVTSSEATNILFGKLRPAAMEHRGSLVVVSHQLDNLTTHIVWGGRNDAIVLLERIKRKLDPHGILNPGRFVI
jgi:glycolate oxidase FAD binding subunit